MIEAENENMDSLHNAVFDVIWETREALNMEPLASDFILEIPRDL